MPACFVCGSEVSAWANACPVCGTSLVQDAPEAIPVVAEVTGPRLVLYSADAKPLHTIALDRDVTRIGREDAVRGEFVEVDVSKYYDEEAARGVSRKHAVVLRSRASGAFVLRPLPGNTGTQVGTEMVGEDDVPLGDGTRIVLGGTVRIKFHDNGG